MNLLKSKSKNSTKNNQECVLTISLVTLSAMGKGKLRKANGWKVDYMDWGGEYNIPKQN